MPKPRKPGNRRDNHKAARALAEWARHGFTRATEQQIADTYEIAVRTLWRWKDALDTDPELSALFRDLLNDHLNRTWSDHLDAALTASITRMLDLIRTSHKLNEVTEAFRALSEIAITREVLHAATHGETGHERPPAGAATPPGDSAGTQGAYN